MPPPKIGPQGWSIIGGSAVLDAASAADKGVALALDSDRINESVSLSLMSACDPMTNGISTVGAVCHVTFPRI